MAGHPSNSHARTPSTPVTPMSHLTIELSSFHKLNIGMEKGICRNVLEEVNNKWNYSMYSHPFTVISNESNVKKSQSIGEKARDKKNVEKVQNLIRKRSQQT